WSPRFHPTWDICLILCFKIESKFTFRIFGPYIILLCLYIYFPGHQRSGIKINRTFKIGSEPFQTLFDNTNRLPLLVYPDLISVPAIPYGSHFSLSYRYINLQFRINRISVYTSQIPFYSTGAKHRAVTTIIDG